ncbi:MAG TPA: hypothetical protein VGK10_09920 [Prolixibacteraceae bacterium]|jgi:hypothetical protein
MKTILKHFLTLVIFTALLIACDRPVCKNTNPLFDKYPPDSREYKAELIKQLERIDQSKLSYWFNEYYESNGQEQLFFNIQGDGLCAVIVLNVEEWGKLEELRQKKGQSYRGAKFTKLQFDIRKDTVNPQFIYRDFDKIID